MLVGRFYTHLLSSFQQTLEFLVSFKFLLYVQKFGAFAFNSFLRFILLVTNFGIFHNFQGQHTLCLPLHYKMDAAFSVHITSNLIFQESLEVSC